MCYLLDLINDAALIREYCQMHEPGSVWPAVIDHIHARGVQTMEIWQHGDRLFMVMDVADDYPRRAAAKATQQESNRWEIYMSKFQRGLPGAAPQETWLPLRRIFVLAEHHGVSES
jgi:L-rhamnose mutarotase